MLKQLSKLELIIENKVYHLLCDSDSPLHHVKEALFQFSKFIGQMEDNVKAQQEAAKAPDAPAPDISPEKPPQE